MLTDTLCTRCGLCCDGTLFGDVELRGPAEAARVEALGLEVDTDDADSELLALPCAGLHGTRCSVYPHRPQCCRTFECRLLQQAKRGDLSVNDAIARIDDARGQVRAVTALLATFEGRGTHRPRLPLAERVANALAATPSARERAHAPEPGEIRDRQADLRAASAALTGTLRTTFLE